MITTQVSTTRKRNARVESNDIQHESIGVNITHWRVWMQLYCLHLLTGTPVQAQRVEDDTSARDWTDPPSPTSNNQMMCLSDTNKHMNGQTWCVWRMVQGPMRENRAVRMPGILFSTAAVKGHCATEASTQLVLLGSFAGMVYTNGTTFQSCPRSARYRLRSGQSNHFVAACGQGTN